jgi:hypothetical protein
MEFRSAVADLNYIGEEPSSLHKTPIYHCCINQDSSLNLKFMVRTYPKTGTLTASQELSQVWRNMECKMPPLKTVDFNPHLHAAFVYFIIHPSTSSSPKWTAFLWSNFQNLFSLMHEACHWARWVSHLYPGRVLFDNNSPDWGVCDYPQSLQAKILLNRPRPLPSISFRIQHS